jgi:hypothetical protein
MSGKKLYSKPEFKYWSAAELDTIQAQMSGGGGGGGGGLRLKWDDKWIISGSEGDFPLVVGVVAEVIALIASKNLPFSHKVGGVVTTTIANWFISRSFTVIYYIRYVQHLYMYVGTTGSGYEAWDYVGSAVRADYYGNSDFTNYAGAIEFNTVPSAFSYMLPALRW